MAFRHEAFSTSPLALDIFAMICRDVSQSLYRASLAAKMMRALLT